MASQRALLFEDVVQKSLRSINRYLKRRLHADTKQDLSVQMLVKLTTTPIKIAQLHSFVFDFQLATVRRR